MGTTTREQRFRSRDKACLDRLVRGEEPLKHHLRIIVEIRAIGHRLNGEGGFQSMVSAAERAGELSHGRSTRRSIEADWDGIGCWQG